MPSGGWWFDTPPNYSNGGPAVCSDQQGSWAFAILPFLDAITLWEGRGAQNDLQRTIQAIATPLPVFFCPTRRGMMTVTYSDPAYMGGLTLTHALIDYAASNWEQTGAIKQYYVTRPAEISDGFSHTLLVAEKRLNRSLMGSLDETGLPPPDDNEGYTAGWDEDAVRKTGALPVPDPNDSVSADPAENPFGARPSPTLAMQIRIPASTCSVPRTRNCFRRFTWTVRYT